MREVAMYLRVHVSTIARLLKRQEIPAFKIGSDWRFKKSSIDEWLAACEQAQTPKSGALGTAKKR
jgi:excisionase family DNA binding protein